MSANWLEMDGHSLALPWRSILNKTKLVEGQDGFPTSRWTGKEKTRPQKERDKAEEEGEFPVLIRWKESHPSQWQKQAGSQMDLHAIYPYQQADFRNCGPPDAQGLSSLLVIKKRKKNETLWRIRYKGNGEFKMSSVLNQMLEGTWVKKVLCGKWGTKQRDGYSKFAKVNNQKLCYGSLSYVQGWTTAGVR